MDSLIDAYFIFRDNMPMNINVLAFFLRKYVHTAAKTMPVDRNKQTNKQTKQNALALPYLALGPRPKYCEPKRFADRFRSRTDSKEDS